MQRRNLLKLYLAGGAASLLVAGCTAQQVSDTEKQVAAVIQQVQAGVVQACAAAGKLVPTANTVFAVLAAIVGNTNVAIATTAMIVEAVAQIAAVGCPPPAVGARTRGSTASGISVSFY